MHICMNLLNTNSPRCVGMMLVNWHHVLIVAREYNTSSYTPCYIITLNKGSYWRSYTDVYVRAMPRGAPGCNGFVITHKHIKSFLGDNYIRTGR